jgi:hypothetical protein
MRWVSRSRYDGDQQSVQHGGAGALVFAYFRADVRRNADRQTGEFSLDAVAQLLLVRRVGVGVQQGDGDGLGVMPADRVQRRQDGGSLQRGFDAAIGADALHNAQTAVARDQRRLVMRLQAVDVAPGVAPDLEHVAEALGGDQHAARQLALQHRVGGDGGAVQQEPDVGQSEPEAAGGFGDACHQADGRVSGRGRSFQAVLRAGRFI